MRLKPPDQKGGSMPLRFSGVGIVQDSLGALAWRRGQRDLVAGKRREAWPGHSALGRSTSPVRTVPSGSTVRREEYRPWT